MTLTPNAATYFEERAKGCAERVGARKAGAQWRASLDMVTDDRVEKAARILFPDSYHDGTDCLSEVERIGLPCRHCAERFDEWLGKLKLARVALESAFS